LRAPARLFLFRFGLDVEQAGQVREVVGVRKVALPANRTRTGRAWSVAPSSAVTSAAAFASGTSTVAPRPTSAILPTCLESNFPVVQTNDSTTPGGHRGGTGRCGSVP
jgi:hypothetical protein